MSDDITLQVSRHAYERAKSRFRWKSTVLDKMAYRAFHEGIRHCDTNGRVNKYITDTFLAYKTATNIRIHGDVVYLFSGNGILITLYSLPNEYRKYVKAFK
jgi:hypothetical protein